MVSWCFTGRFHGVFTVFSQCFGVFAACFAFRRAFRPRFRGGAEHFDVFSYGLPYGGAYGDFSMVLPMVFGLWSWVMMDGAGCGCIYLLVEACISLLMHLPPC